MIWFVLSALAVVGWLYLLRAHGGFWRADERLRPAPDPDAWPDVVAVIPARDEAETVYQTITSHQRSDYPGGYSIVLIDDGSVDGTAEIAAEAGADGPRRLSIITAPELEPGWTGKLWAIHHGLREARSVSPDAEYILLTDADIAHSKDTLRRLVARSERDRLGLLSLMAELDARGFWGALLVPSFVFFFQKLYPFRWVNDPNRYLAAAAGGCMLVRREALREEGGVAAIRRRLIDDCALAGMIKGEPPKRPIRIGLASGEVISLRDNRRLSSIWTMVARTAFEQLGRSYLLTAGAVAGLAVLYLGGPLAFLLWPFHGYAPAAAAGALAWGLAAYAYGPTIALYRKPAAWSLSLPFAAAFYLAMTVSSAWSHARGRGGEWKGRMQAVAANERGAADVAE